MTRTCISFSLYDSAHDWQNLFYVRGTVLNVMMIKHLAPDYAIELHVERSVAVKYNPLLAWLADKYDAQISILNESTPCEMMLWRLKPLFGDRYDYVFCRDADSLVTGRDLKCMEDFMANSGKVLHNIWDNQAHTGCMLMGGLSGYRCEPLREKYKSWSSLIESSPISINKHGTDQDFLTLVVYDDFIDQHMQSNFPRPVNDSDLCVPFLGSAGVNEMETLRYLRNQGVDIMMPGLVRAGYERILYWR